MTLTPQFSKYPDGLIPAIIQDQNSGTVLMLAYMNENSLQKTITEKKLCFYSRSRKRLWTKGETSGNFLLLEDIIMDCDNDCFLIKATPLGPVCHTGTDTCFGESNPTWSLDKLESIINDRKHTMDPNSYTSALFSQPIGKIAQKVGEEAVELVIESLQEDQTRFVNEAADLLFHYLVLLQAKGHKLQDVIEVLEQRNQQT